MELAKCSECRIVFPYVNLAIRNTGMGEFLFCQECFDVKQFKSPLKQKIPNAAPLDKAGVRHDQDKLRWDLVPMHLLEGMVKVLMMGMKKYSAHNWRLGLHTTRISNSLQRHLNAYLAGEELDPESGLSHVDHILCNALFLKGQAVEHPEMDDRYKTPKSGIGYFKPNEPYVKEDLNALSALDGKAVIDLSNPVKLTKALDHESTTPWLQTPS